MQLEQFKVPNTQTKAVRPFSRKAPQAATGAWLSEDMRTAFQAIPAGILFVNSNGLVELANQSAQALFQTNIEGSLWRTVITSYFEPRKDDGLEVSLVNGRKVKFSISKIPGVPGQLIHLTDLTQTRVLQSKVSHMQRLSALGKMMASLAHQIRTPLSAALLYARNLQNDGLNVDARIRFSEKLITRLKDLEQQINDMLLFAKSGDQDIIEQIDLNKLVRRLVDETKEAQHQGITLRFEALPNACVIQGNRTAIFGALNNIVQNAISVGATQIKIVLERQENKSRATLAIADNGPGIPPNLLAKVFEPFFTTRAQGTGLGLSVVRSVMNSHKGKVEVTNQGTGGALFTLHFPLGLSGESVAADPCNQNYKAQIEGELA